MGQRGDGRNAEDPLACPPVEASLGGRDLRLLVLSTGLSSLGDELALIALAIKVADLTDSGWAVAGLLLAGLLPLVIFAPAAGVIVDNFETRRTLAIASGVQAIIAGWLAFTTGLPGILMLAFLLGTCTAVASPAIYTLAPAVVGEEHATEGNAYLETARYVGMIGGPVLAGTISAGLSSRVALLVDAATFVVIALSAVALRVRRHPEPETAEDGEVRAGFGFVLGDRLLLIGFVTIGAIVLFAAMDNVAEVFFARDTLGAGGWGYGLLASVWLVGMAIGASLIARRLGKGRLMQAMATAAVVGGAAVAVAGIAGVLWLALAMFLVGGLANGVITVSMRSLIVHRTPDRHRGRVFAAYGGLMNGTQLLAIGGAGALVATLGGQSVLVIGGFGTVVAGIAGLTAYATLPAEVRAMPGGEEEEAVPAEADTDVAPDVAPEPAIAGPFGATTLEVVPDPPEIPDRPDVTHLPDSEQMERRRAAGR